MESSGSGLTSEWRLVPGFLGYQVSNSGQVRSIVNGTWKQLKPTLTSYGYHRVSLVMCTGKKKHMQVHRIVALAFIGPDNGLVVNHKNGIKTDNCVSNLEWVSRKRNVQHAVELGLMRSGEEHHNSKLTEELVREIRERAKTEPQKSIAKEMQLSTAIISQVVRRRRWNNVL